MSNEDKVVIDGPHGVKRKIDKYLRDNPDNKYGGSAEEVFESIKEILVKAPALVSSVYFGQDDF